MTTPSRREDILRALCARIEAEDGAAPSARERRRDASGSASARKDHQLCKQALRAISLALSADIGDPLLRGLEAVRVEPAPDASRLRVTVRVPAGVGAGEAMARLSRARGALRAALAEQISRKRVPDLVFQPSDPTEDGGHDE